MNEDNVRPTVGALSTATARARLRATSSQQKHARHYLIVERLFQVQQVKINPLYGRLPRGENAADIFRWHPNDSLFPARG